MKKLLPLFLFVLFISCLPSKPSPASKFSEQGVSFDCPAGWKITETDSMEGDGYYLSCEMDGFTSSALVTMAWVNDSMDLDAMLELYQGELKNNEIFKHTNIEFDLPADGSYNGISARLTNYHLTLLDDKTEGTLYCFYGPMKTFAIVVQESTEDHVKNKSGFDVIENSFIVK